MIHQGQLASFFALNLSLIRRQTEGLDHSDSLLQPPVRGNCLNWILGHILVGRDHVLRLLGEQPLLSAETTACYETDSDPITQEKDGILSLPVLLEHLQTSQERINAGLERATEVDLSTIIDPDGSAATVGRQIFGLYFHDTYHTGQTELLRQLTGSDDKIV